MYNPGTIFDAVRKAMPELFGRADRVATNYEPAVSDDGVIKGIVSPQILEILHGIGLKYPQCTFGDAKILTNDETKARTVILTNAIGMRFGITHDCSLPSSDERKTVTIGTQGREHVTCMTILVVEKNHLTILKGMILDHAAQLESELRVALRTKRDENIASVDAHRGSPSDRRKLFCLIS